MHLSLILLLLQLWGNVEISSSQNVCSKLPDVLHAHVSEQTKKAEYEFGNEIHFTCETGYISGLPIRYTCTTTGWFLIRRAACYLRPCELPENTPNGYFEIIRGEDFVFGTTIKYFCNEGYQMVSKDDTRTCLLDKWTNHVPICDPLSCDPPPADENITVKGLPQNEEPILPDRFLTFSCDSPGTYLNGSSMLICGKDGQWDNPFPSCEEITCKIETVDPHVSVSLTPSSEPIKIGHKLRFQCDNRYTLEGSKETACLETGQWSAPFPICNEKCEVTDVPGSIRIETQVPNNLLGKGQSLKFLCRRYDHFIQGKAKVECLGNGQWSHTFPTCGPPVNCQKPPPLENGDTRESTRPQYRHNERVEYVCQSVYTMDGDRYKTCINGEWTGQMRCLKPCTVDKEAMSQRNIAFKYSRDDKLYSPHNDEIEFSCTSYRGRPVGRVAMRQRCVNGVMNLPTCQ